MSQTGKTSTSWFSTFVQDAEKAVEAGWAAIQPEVAKVETAVVQYAPEVVGKMAQLAADAVTAQFGVNIPGEQKLGKAVTLWVERVEAQLGFKPSEADANAAIQATYHVIAAKKAAS